MVPKQPGLNRRGRDEKLKIHVSEQFIKGDIYYKSQVKIPQVPLRLNLYNDQFEYLDENLVLALANQNRIDRIVVEDDVFIHIAKSSIYKVSGFVKLWNSNLPGIITKMRVDFLKKEKIKAIEESKPNRFERVADKHYIMKSNYEIEKISSIRKLIKYLGTHSNELTGFAQKGRISVNDPEELAKLLKYYHGLD